MPYLVVRYHHCFMLGTMNTLCHCNVDYLIIINKLFGTIYYDIICIAFTSVNDCIIAFYLLRKNVTL